MWSASAIEHFQEDRFLGHMQAPDLQAETGSAGQPDYLRLQFRMEGDLVVDIRFTTVRCLSAIACANYACRWALGRSPLEFEKLRAADILLELGPLPGNKSLWANRVWSAFQQAAHDWRKEC